MISPRHSTTGLSAMRACLIFLLTLVSLTAFAGGPFSKIVTFGDSLSDTGYAYELTGGLFPPSPPNATGRLSNGLLWTEHLARLLKLPLQPGNQYAVAGALTDTRNLNAAFGLSPLANTGLASQIATYLEDAGPSGADPSALHTIWIGANDIFSALSFGGDMNDAVFHAVQNTAQAVVALAGHGARHILVVNLPDLGLTPFGRSLGPVMSVQLTALVDAYNAALQQALDAIASVGIVTIRLDSAQLIRDMVQHPAFFGFVNVTDAAVTSPTSAASYLFWDQVHPTTHGHRAVAQRALAALIAFYSNRKGNVHAPGLANCLKGLVRASGH